MKCSLYVLPDSVDVNVTPDKRQVMLHHEKTLLLIIRVRRPLKWEHCRLKWDMCDNFPQVSLACLFEPMQGSYDAVATPTRGIAMMMATTASSSPDTPTLSTLTAFKR